MYDRMPSNITILIPVLNEELAIQHNLQYFQALAAKFEIIFVDGNSSDQTVQLLKDNQLKVITSPKRGRGAQLSYGGSNVDECTDLLLFLHIDTKLPDGFELKIHQSTDLDYWGRFDVKLDSDKTIFRIIQLMMNFRAKVTGIATGDQAIYVTKNEFMTHADNMIERPLMEDIYLSKALKASLGRGNITKDPVITSVRYWENNGIIKTIAKMWKYRLMYFFGASPQDLYQRYYK